MRDISLPSNEVLRTPHPQAPFSSSPAFRVTLWVVEGLKTTDLKPRSYFVRCHEPGHATVLAEKHFQKWERHADEYAARNQQPPLFPDTRGPGIAICIDEGDWNEYLDDAIRMGRRRGVSLYSTDRMFSPAGVLNFRYPIVWSLPGFAVDVDSSMEPTNEQMQDKDLPVHIFAGRDRQIGDDDDGC